MFDVVCFGSQTLCGVWTVGIASALQSTSQNDVSPDYLGKLDQLVLKKGMYKCEGNSNSIKKSLGMRSAWYLQMDWGLGDPSRRVFT